MHYKKHISILLASALLLKMILASIIPLGIDESYYLLYGRYFDWHYYDHPFMTGLVLKLFTKFTAFSHPFFYRLPFVLASVLSTYIIFLTGTLLQNSRTGWFAALLFSASFYFFIIGGLFTMPDALMVLFWVMAIYFAASYFFYHAVSESVKAELLIWFGLATGLAMASKIHAVLLWVGFGGFALFYQRSVFRQIYFWIAGCISLLAWLPMLIWNMQNDWVHFAFYNSRVGADQGLRFDYFLREFIGEFFYQNPVIWVAMIYFGCLKFGKTGFGKQKIFLLFFSFPLLLMIWLLSLFRETLPHWTGPAYAALILLSSIGMTEHDVKLPAIMGWYRTAFIFLFFLLVLGLSVIHFYPGTLGEKSNSKNYGRHDFTLDMYGWKSSGDSMASRIRQADLQHIPIFTDNWFPAAQIDEYISRKSGNTVFGVGDLNRIHQYKWINERRGGLPATDSALYISVSNYPSQPEKIYGDRFSNIQCIDSVAETRNGHLTRYFHLYLMTSKR
jgi:hypothetical protein